MPQDGLKSAMNADNFEAMNRGQQKGQRLRNAAAGLAAGLILLVPAMINGFPFLFDDTGGYLDRAYRWDLGNGRSMFYGLALRVFSLPGLNFWPAVLLQALAAVWLMTRVMKGAGFGLSPRGLILLSLGLTLFTSAAWFVGQLMPDMWGPLMIVAIALLAAMPERFTTAEKWGLGVIAAFGGLVHMSYLGIACGMLIVLAFWRAVPLTTRWFKPALLLPALPILAALVIMPLFHGVVTGRFTYTPGGNVFILGRLIQDGIVKDYLAEVCPEAGLKLCAAGENLPTTANDFLWGNDVATLNKFGNFEGMEDEAAFIVRETVKRYPLRQLKTALIASAEQFVAFSTGDGFNAWLWHTKWVFETHMPDVIEAYSTALQQTGQSQVGRDIGWINWVHTPIALASLAGLFLMIVPSFRRDPAMAAILVLFILALMGNSVINGALSNVQGRYQSRLIWFAPVLLLAAWRIAGAQIQFPWRRK